MFVETQNLWATYFKNYKSEQELIKGLPALILMKKLITIILKNDNNLDIISKIGLDRKLRLTNNLE